VAGAAGIEAGRDPSSCVTGATPDYRRHTVLPRHGGAGPTAVAALAGRRLRARLGGGGGDSGERRDSSRWERFGDEDDDGEQRPGDTERV
jgi:hypothetical protein